MCVFSVADVSWCRGHGAQAPAQELQFNNGAMAAAEFVDFPEFSPLIKTELLEG